MTEDLNTRLEHAAQGITPQTCPDERRRYLGSLRERVLIRMTVEETNNQKLDTLFLKHIDDYKGYTILINGKMPQNDFISKLMGLCSQKDIKFTLINDDNAKDEPNSTGILVVSKTAINHYRVEINQVYAPEVPNERLTERKKPSFWDRLFRKKD
ncbi:YueI family protein [Lactobacillus taiwanensis]|uniref:YueI family protein n=1 Tax=Lactobacillus taiwanensis TaxID=508451 RepID=UPI00241CB1AF|nr:YueI family protein [Lactobacillus taiwanensis]